jgi:hypothetical protein
MNHCTVYFEGRSHLVLLLVSSCFSWHGRVAHPSSVFTGTASVTRRRWQSVTIRSMSFMAEVERTVVVSVRRFPCNRLSGASRSLISCMCVNGPQWLRLRLCFRRCADPHLGIKLQHLRSSGPSYATTEMGSRLLCTNLRLLLL